MGKQILANRMIYVERKTQKNFLSPRWELSPRPSMGYTAFSKKVVGKNVHATNPKGNMGYDQSLFLTL